LEFGNRQIANDKRRNLPSQGAKAELHFDFVLDDYAEILALRRVDHTADNIRRHRRHRAKQLALREVSCRVQRAIARGATAGNNGKQVAG